MAGGVWSLSMVLPAMCKSNSQAELCLREALSLTFSTLLNLRKLFAKGSPTEVMIKDTIEHATALAAGKETR